MSIECFEVNFEKELPFILAELDQRLRDESLLVESIYHNRITNILL